ncbi:MAG TPA: IPT/TIG domain-containing protein [Kofleriaceae bacterium]|nr:IPT/TIG domain-containing protein [Kofleriaceae bacterium]
MRAGATLALALAACSAAGGPAIDRLEPATASRGDSVTVRGAGFCGPDRVADSGECTSPPSGAVDLGLSPPMTRATVLAWSDAAITVQVPGTAPLGPTALIVTVDGRSSNAATLEVTP